MNRPRLANKNDAPAMVEILNYYTKHSTTTFLMEPQTLEDRLSWFDQRSEIHPAIAVELEGAVIALGALSAHNPRGGYRHTADVSVYVHPDFQRREWGA